MMTKPNMLYRQILNISKDRESKAPYNFVQQPEKILLANGLAIKPWLRHDEFIEKNFSGSIEVEIKNKTPIYIKGPREKNNDQFDSRDSRLRPEPFLDKNGKAIIPGSSFRGCIRNIYEILTFSKLKPVPENKLFFRSMGTDSMGIKYRNLIGTANNVPKGGFLEKDDDGYFIRPCKVQKVPHKAIPGFMNSYDDRNPNYLPPENLQNSNFTYKGISGVLVLTGAIRKKKHEFLFSRINTNQKFRIPEDIVKRFLHSDQLTQWQMNAFKKGNGRTTDGGLKVGEPIFYKLNDSLKGDKNPDGLVFFGRARMFRYPYPLTPQDLLKQSVDNEDEIDFAEAMFGTTKKVNGKQVNIKGRVSFENLYSDHLVENDEIIVPKLLLGPKPTCFQHYLVQTSQEKDHLRTYFEENRTFLRGHKLYWHRWDDSKGLNQVKEERHADLKIKMLSNQPDKTHCLMKPVPEETVFRGKIRFNNLSKLELGALLTALVLEEKSMHKLGMGKPLGLGSVKVTVLDLSLIDFQNRYRSWKNERQNNDLSEFTNYFEQRIVNEIAKRTGEQMISENDGLRKVYRFDTLLTMLDFQNKPLPNLTKYQGMEIFRDRKVLPTPKSVVAGNFANEPAVPPAQPTVTIKIKPEEEKAESTIAPPPDEKEKTLQQGQSNVKGVLQKKKDCWKAFFPDYNETAEVMNPKKIPGNTEDNSKAYFFIRIKKKKEFKVQFDRFIKK